MNRLKSISFRQLRALESIAYHQGLKPAAVALNLTVPAVHSQLAQLEQSVGVPLFDRGRRGFVLTSEGEVLLRAFITSQNELGRALAHIDSLRKGEAGVLTLGVVSTGKYFAPSLIGKFKALYPDIQITLRIGNRRRTIEALERKKIDMAIIRMCSSPRPIFRWSQGRCPIPTTFCAKPSSHAKLVQERGF